MNMQVRQKNKKLQKEHTYSTHTDMSQNSTVSLTNKAVIQSNTSRRKYTHITHPKRLHANNVHAHGSRTAQLILATTTARPGICALPRHRGQTNCCQQTHKPTSIHPHTKHTSTIQPQYIQRFTIA